MLSTMLVGCNKEEETVVEVETEEGLTIHQFIYPNGEINPSSYIKTKNNVIQKYNINYEGKRIIQFGDSSYKYNSEGIRISKIINIRNDNGVIIVEEQHYYELEGSKILSEVIIDIDGNKFRLDYNYDINNELVSVEYGGTRYYYIKDALGNINYIVDGNRNIMVKYEYDEWGVSTKTIVQSACPIVELNPFMYKSYYYDVETQLFY